MARETNEVQGFMPVWIADYLRDTQHLTRDQHGAYLLILFAYWVNGGALPDSDGRMAAIVRATPQEWKRLRPVIVEFFQVRDGLWWHKRAEAELQKARDLKEAQRLRTEAATAARLAKSGGPKTVVTSHVTSHVTSDLTSTPSPSPLVSEPKGSSTNHSHTAPAGEDEDFERFWNTYPRRADSSQIRTREAWDEVAEHRPPIAELLAAIGAYEREVQAENAKRTRGSPTTFCHPARWLTDRRWAGAVKPKLYEVVGKDRGIPEGWKPIAEAFAKARSWSLWDALMTGCRIADGPPLSIEFNTRSSRAVADDNGLLAAIESIAEGLEADVIVSTRGRIAA